jgi:hypothetical protein
MYGRAKQAGKQAERERERERLPSVVKPGDS